MSFNSDQLTEKIKTMESNEAVEILISILTSSKNIESKLKAAELLVNYEDDKKERLQDIKNIFLNDQH
ncbi:MAG: hypothetical protein ACFE9S_15695, partial [Candidatus Hermodarchaeota archaeon]